MKELWCDFDGVIVPNVLSEINTSDITIEEFTELVTKFYLSNPITSQIIRNIISEYKSDGSKANIITGRKKSYLSDITERILDDHNITVDRIYYYPEEGRYVVSDYYDWKAYVISNSLALAPNKEVRVIDDDKGLLKNIKKNISYDNLTLTCYEFFKDGSETLKNLY